MFTNTKTNGEHLHNFKSFALLSSFSYSGHDVCVCFYSCRDVTTQDILWVLSLDASQMTNKGVCEMV